MVDLLEWSVTAVATAFCGEYLTLSELGTVYEVIWGQHLDPSNFRRKVLNTTGFVKPTGDRRFLPPAALYCRGDAWLLNPPLLRGTGTPDDRRAVPSGARGRPRDAVIGKASPEGGVARG